MSVDPAFDSESRRELLRTRSSFGSLPVAVAEKLPEGRAAHTPSLATVEVEPDPLAREPSVRRDRMHHGPLLPHLSDVRTSEELLHLPLRIGCDYAVANPLGHHGIGIERSAFGVGLTTRSPRETRGVEVL